MTIEQVLNLCYWYLDHVWLFLIPAAVFDIICWIGIFFVVRHHRRKGVVLANQPPTMGA